MTKQISRIELNNILKHDSQYASFRSDTKSLFVINQMIEDIQSKEDYNPKLLIYYLYFVHYIIDRNNRLKSNILDRVPINAKRIQTLLDVRYYKEVLRFLIDNKFIVRDYYVPQNEVKGIRGRYYHYGLNPHYIQYPIQRQKFTDKIIKSINGKQFHLFYTKAFDKVQDHNKIKYIAACLNDLKIHDDKAIDFINNSDIDKFQYYSRYNSINQFNNNTNFVIDNTGGRLHTKLTTLSSDLRERFLYLESEPLTKLVQLDVGNSQPLFFALLLMSKYNGNDLLPSYGLNVQDAEYQLLRSLNEHKHKVPKIYKAEYKSELKKYTEWVESGEFYTKFNLDVKMDKHDYSNFKTNFFAHVFYNKWKKRYITSAEKIFMSHFPIIFNIICHIKHDDYKQFPIELQQMESNFMINYVVDTLIANNLFFVTIHDAVIVKEQDVDFVKDVMLNLFSEYGIKAKIKIDELVHPQTVSNENLNLNKREFENFEVNTLVDKQFRIDYLTDRITKEYKQTKIKKLKSQITFFNLMKKNKLDIFNTSDDIFFKIETNTIPIFVNHNKTIKYDKFILKCKNQKDFITHIKTLIYDTDL